MYLTECNTCIQVHTSMYVKYVCIVLYLRISKAPLTVRLSHKRKVPREKSLESTLERL